MRDVSESFQLLHQLISSFIAGHESPSSFELKYMRLWRECGEAGHLPALNADSRAAFDRIFTAADCYCGASDLRDAQDLDDDQFTVEVVRIFQDVPKSFG